MGQPSDGVRDIPDVSMFAANGLWGHYEVVCWSDPSQTSAGAASCTAAHRAPGQDSAEPRLPLPPWRPFKRWSIKRPARAGAIPIPSTTRSPKTSTASLAELSKASGCNSSGSGGPAYGCVFNDVTQGDIDLACEYNGTLKKPTAISHPAPTECSARTMSPPLRSSTAASGYTTAPTCAIAGPSNNSPTSPRPGPHFGLAALRLLARQRDCGSTTPCGR